MQLSVMDQEYAHKKIMQWYASSPNSHSHFRPYKQMEDYEENLLWVHQEQWQQDLLIKYGNVISLMDATYKTRRSVEHCTPHTDGAWLNELGWSQ